MTDATAGTSTVRDLVVGSGLATVGCLSRLLRGLRSLSLTATQWVAVAAGVGVLAVSGAVLAVTTEDVTQHNGLAASDASHLRFFTDHRTDRIVRAARLITEAGAAPILALLAAVAAVVLWWRGARVIVAIAPAVSLGMAGLAAAMAKQIVGRARPGAGLRLVTETESSFPSGHATDSTAFYVALALVVAVFVLRRPLARGMAVAASVVVSAAIGLTRLVLGVHWPTDVLAGWALGSTAALLVVLSVYALTRRTPIAPDASRPALLRTRIVKVLHAQRTPRHRTAELSTHHPFG